RLGPLGDTLAPAKSAIISLHPHQGDVTELVAVVRFRVPERVNLNARDFHRSIPGTMPVPRTPPSTFMASPVTNPERSERKNITAFTTSSTRPIRPKGTACSLAANRLSGDLPVLSTSSLITCWPICVEVI